MTLIDASIIARISRLDLRARQVMEGIISGMHRSPFKGYSVEFAQHRGYVPGDDLKHLDWKVWGKSERYYIKQYEADTNLITTILVDASASMAYGGSRADGRLSKFAYAQLTAASLSHLILGQSVGGGAGVFRDQLFESTPASTRRAHLQRICAVLEDASAEGATGVAQVLHSLCAPRRRGVIVLVSDIFDEPEGVIAGLRHLRHDGHDVVVLQVIDPDELHFPFEGMAQFRGLEQSGHVKCHPRSIRATYLEELQRHLGRITAACQSLGVDHVLASTDQPVAVMLSSFLARRAAKAGVGAVPGARA